MSNTEEKTSFRSRLAAIVTIGALFAASVAAVIFGEDLNPKKSAREMDNTAKVYFNAQGYDVVKRKSYREFEDKSYADGSKGIYHLNERATGKAFEGAVTCARSKEIPELAVLRTCSAHDIKPLGK